MAKSARYFGGRAQWRDWEKYDARVKSKAIKYKQKRVARYERNQEVIRGILKKLDAWMKET
jgi:hypothetical protein